LRNFLQEYGPDIENNSLEQILLLSAAYLLGSTVFNGKARSVSREFREFARIFQTVRENSREFVAKEMHLPAFSRSIRESHLLQSAAQRSRPVDNLLYLKSEF
jgi:hypothetical protein